MQCTNLFQSHGVRERLPKYFQDGMSDIRVGITNQELENHCVSTGVKNSQIDKWNRQLTYLTASTVKGIVI